MNARIKIEIEGHAYQFKTDMGHSFTSPELSKDQARLVASRIINGFMKVAVLVSELEQEIVEHQLEKLPSVGGAITHFKEAVLKPTGDCFELASSFFEKHLRNNTMPTKEEWDKQFKP